jgi:hypothetical protein
LPLPCPRKPASPSSRIISSSLISAPLFFSYAHGTAAHATAEVLRWVQERAASHPGPPPRPGAEQNAPRNKKKQRSASRHLVSRSRRDTASAVPFLSLYSSISGNALLNSLDCWNIGQSNRAAKSSYVATISSLRCYQNSMLMRAHHGFIICLAPFPNPQSTKLHRTSFVLSQPECYPWSFGLWAAAQILLRRHRAHPGLDPLTFPQLTYFTLFSVLYTDRSSHIRAKCW